MGAKEVGQISGCKMVQGSVGAEMMVQSNVPRAEKSRVSPERRLEESEARMQTTNGIRLQLPETRRTQHCHATTEGIIFGRPLHSILSTKSSPPSIIKTTAQTFMTGSS